MNGYVKPVLVPDLGQHKSEKEKFQIRLLQLPANNPEMK